MAFPIEQGVGLGVLLSVLHGVWTTTRARAIEFERIPGTSVWWPHDKNTKGEFVAAVRVIALQAPLSFLNAYNFRRAIERFCSEGPPKLIVIEANALVEIDYTGATVLAELVGRAARSGYRRGDCAAGIRAGAGELRAAWIVRADWPRPCFPQRAGGDRRPGGAARHLTGSRASILSRRKHRYVAPMTDIPIGIVTISDRAFRGVYEDKGGPGIEAALRELLASPWRPERRVVPDERPAIEAALIALADEARCSLILTTGGTGPAPRDVTPEATEAVCDRLLPGFGELMRFKSLAEVPTAILSRQVAGTRGSSLIINLPGKPAAIRTCLDAVFAAAPYCIDLIGGARLETNPQFCTAFRPKA